MCRWQTCRLFLRFEGVLDDSYLLKMKERRYNIKKVTVNAENDQVNCFTLLGCAHVAEQKVPNLVKVMKRYEFEELLHYVRTAMKGAVSFGINLAPFEKDLSRIESWRKTN